MTAALEIERLTKEFHHPITLKKIRVVDDLNLVIREGETFGFLGPNGAGKTTTLKLINGLLRPTAGRIEIFGRDHREVRVKARLGFLPENPYFYDYLSAEEFLEFYAQLFGMGRHERRLKARKLLERVGLGDRAREPLRKFSKGMTQRLGLAQALINDPALVILDEPMSGLDPVGRRDVRDIILELKKEGRTVFFSSHLIPDVEMICDRVGILIKGSLRDQADLNERLAVNAATCEVRVAGISKETFDRVAAFSKQTAASGSDILVEVPGDGSVEKLIDLVRADGGRIVSVTPRRESLEALFLREVRDPAGENAGEGPGGRSSA
ncbi:MAG: ABC transporter ATP-binding protein [Myxococcota bacterium]